MKQKTAGKSRQFAKRLFAAEIAIDRQFSEQNGVSPNLRMSEARRQHAHENLFVQRDLLIAQTTVRPRAVYSTTVRRGLHRYLGRQEKIRSLPPRFKLNERMEPNVPENIRDMYSLNDRILSGEEERMA